MRIGAYYDGLAFSVSWAYPFVVLPLMLLAVLAFISYLFGALADVVFKMQKPSALAPFLAMLLAFGAVWYLPLPTFVDGLHDTVEEKLQRGRLLEMAQMVRELQIDWIDSELHPEKLAALRARFPAELSLGPQPARVKRSDDVVSVYYGGALPKHWGYVVVEHDRCPLDYLPPALCRKVFDQVWVFQDIW